MKVTKDKQNVYLDFENGMILLISLKLYPVFKKATPKQLNNVRFIGESVGIRWDDLNEEIPIIAQKEEPDFTKKLESAVSGDAFAQYVQNAVLKYAKDAFKPK